MRENPQATPTQTWADVKDSPSLEGLSISIHAFGEVTEKIWLKAAMESSHWDRIKQIAETANDRLAATPHQGFSWVCAVLIGEEAIPMCPPIHLAGLITKPRGE